MPEALERKLKRRIAKKGWSKERRDAYVYGTLRKTGWKPSRERSYKRGSGVLVGNAVLKKVGALK